mgnify:CR=1 FL=1
MSLVSPTNRKTSPLHYLIICGDVGICGFSAAYEANTRAVFRSLPVTTLFIDGNHENFEQLNFYAVEQWNGGKVHIIEDNMIHLMRGQIFTIDGLKFFTFGGAYSIDKMSRAEGISWFPEEIPSREEYEEGWKNLEKKIRDWAIADSAIIIICGPIIEKHPKTIGKNKVVVPQKFFKVVLSPFVKPMRAIGFLFNNEQAVEPLSSYAVTIDSIESLTNMDFFAPLPDEIENKIEADINYSLWPN